MASDIPLKIRVDIRDLWDSPNSSIHKPIEELTKTLGHKITPIAQWPSLWIELGSRFPDKTVFVPTIISTTIVWYERLLARLDAEEEWAEELLTALAEVGTGGLDLRVEPAPAKANRPSTTWDKKVQVFRLRIPNTDPMSQSRIAAFLEKDFEGLFTPGGAVDDDVDWADVPPAASAAPAEVSRAPPPLQRGPQTAESSVPAAPERLPVLGALARPSDLFPASPPYILTVTLTGREGMIVQCSHEPSLELMNEYLKKWGKRIPMTACGVQFSSLRWSSRISEREPDHYTFLIEGVLGYKMVYTTSSYWMYRCTTLLKK
ncbi:hypothetical protein CPB85DRAFT_1430394 [Mucidula mucida]|nr:hypothetical protein CPB85DRAFT_1430394 [Mucidula mucida]